MLPIPLILILMISGYDLSHDYAAEA
jgi:hypothetical protein